VTARILEGNVFDVLPTIPAGSVDCVVTSPPSLEACESVEFSAFDVELFAHGNVFIRETGCGNGSGRPGSVGPVSIASDFSFVLIPITLECSKFKSYFCLLALDSQKWEQCDNSFLGCEIADGPAPDGTTLAVRWLMSEPSTEDLGHQLKSLSVNHADLDFGVVSRSDPILAGIGFRLFDAEPCFAIDQAGAIGEFNPLSHVTT